VGFGARATLENEAIDEQRHGRPVDALVFVVCFKPADPGSRRDGRRFCPDFLSSYLNCYRKQWPGWI